MDIVWADSAKAQLQDIHTYIAETSEAYADAMIRRMLERIEQIEMFPLSGRSVPEYGHEQIREIIVRPYRVIYHLRPDCIEIIAVVHGRQDISG